MNLDTNLPTRRDRLKESVLTVAFIASFVAVKRIVTNGD